MSIRTNRGGGNVTNVLAAISGHDINPATASIGAGSNSITGGTNAAGSLAKAHYPEGDPSGEPGAKFGTSETGFAGANFYYAAMQNLWINEAWSFTQAQWNKSAIVNVINEYPGAVGSLGKYRSQNLGSNGDFRTDGQFACVAYSSAAYDFTCTVANSGGGGVAVLSALVYDPTADGLLQDAIDIGDVIVLLHSNAGVGIPSTAKILSITSTSITLTENVTGIGGGGTLTDADLSITIIAASANSTLGPFRSYVKKVFTGNLANASAVIDNLKFNPQRVGIQPAATLRGTGIVNDSRIINYTTDGVNHRIQIGDKDTGLPISGTVAGVGVTLSLTTEFGDLTWTGTVSDNVDTSIGSWITAVSVNPVAIGIPTNNTASWDRAQWGVSGIITTNNYVTAISATTITLDIAATTTTTNVKGKIECARLSWRLSIMSAGHINEICDFGWNDDALSAGTHFRLGTTITYNALPLFNAVGEFVGNIGSGASFLATTAQYRAATANKVLAADVAWAAAAPVTLTDAGTIAVDLSTGVNFTVTITNNRTLGNPTNVKVGQSGYINVIQDGSGSHTLAYGANYKFVGGIAPVMTTTAGAKDKLYYTCDSATEIVITHAPDVK